MEGTYGLEQRVCGICLDGFFLMVLASLCKESFLLVEAVEFVFAFIIDRVVDIYI